MSDLNKTTHSDRSQLVLTTLLKIIQGAVDKGFLTCHTISIIASWLKKLSLRKLQYDIKLILDSHAIPVSVVS